MNEPASPKPNDSRLQAALEDYFDRVDRREPVDRESFLAQHQDIAAELRLFIATEDEVRRFAAESRADVFQISTGSFGQLAKETLAIQPPASSTESESGELRGKFGRYRILRSLGQGAMGTVYLAHDTQLERQIALKTPQFTDDSERELLERFYREARLAATLRHPRICPVYDVGDIDGKHYITMAYIEGRPLSEFVNPASPQSVEQILIAVGKLAQALQEAHDHGIVHRDLKPANIMVDRQGEPVIMDFGLAQQMRPSEDVRLTQTGMIIGSPAYMSPEQVEGETAKIGPASDQYGLGIILYELLTGRVPFEGSLASVMSQIVSIEPTPPSRLRPGLDRSIDAVCLKMLAKDPADRFPSLSAVADELARIVRKPSVQSASQQSPRTGWDRWALPAATLVALAGLLALGILYLRAGKSVLAIEINDPGVQVALRGSKVTLTGPGNEEVQVEPGENELTIIHGKLKFKTNTFMLEKGKTQLVKVSLAGPTLAAKLGDQDLILTPLSPTSARKVVATQASEAKAQLPAAVDAKARSPRPHLLASPFDRPVAKTAQENWAKYCKVPIATTNSLGMKFELIPPGAYMMGPFAGHRVRITRPCYFGVYEVTRGQFAQFVAATGYQTLAELSPGGIRLDNNETPTKWEPHHPYTWRSPGFPQDDDHPVVQVAWQDATAFCDWLTRKEGKIYRLPTEAEWEYACRAGTGTRTYYSADIEDTTKIGNVADAAAKAIFPRWKETVNSSDGYAYTSPVGKFLPNNFGLYDTIGNAAEWCSDRYAADYFQHSPQDDPTGPATGDARIGRGGGFTHVAASRFRYWGVDSFRRPDWGFRVVCDIPAAAQPADSAKAR